MEKKYYVVGYKPAYGKEVNDFAKTLDLGTEGAFIYFSDCATVTMKEDATEEQIKNVPSVLKMAYEENGYKEIHIGEAQI